ncbi:FAD/NAD(P)-binding protein [Brevibacterium sp. 50QC2O2]|uniref:FAD/NAD(P)-binding protein n=1 Tax=Brevibacterium sp. 50QC2O2 TaxID=2968459 RepID=UPI00211B8324|nr:FAD/NAD(P)-binding protein [Brevibacterium sp. 50QC2O2]
MAEDIPAPVTESVHPSSGVPLETAVGPHSVAIVGAGPRGTSVLERLSAYAATVPDRTLHVHVCDDAEAGPGEIWDPEQPRELLLNATARQLTLFTDETIGAARVRNGPDLYEWTQLIAQRAGLGGGASVPAAAAELFAAWTAPDYAPAADIFALCAATREDTFLPRAVYGEYLRWYFAGVVRTAPENMRVSVHRARVVGLRPVAGSRADADSCAEESRAAAGEAGWEVEFAGSPEVAGPPDSAGSPEAEGLQGSAGRTQRAAVAPSLRVNDVVLALGWVSNDPGPARPDDPRIAWLPPGHVLRHDLEAIPDRARVVVRGLGLTAMDIIARLTEGRGGVYTAASAGSGGSEDSAQAGTTQGDPIVDSPVTLPRGPLVYRASGREPTVLLASNSGNPYRCKPADYGPEAADHTLLHAAIARAGARRAATGEPVDFAAELYPAVLADAAIAYYRARVRLDGAPVAATAELCAAIAAGGDLGAVDEELLAAACPIPAERFDPVRLRPRVPSPLPAGQDYTAWLRDFFAADAARAEAGPAVAFNAAIGSVSAARGPLAAFTRGRVLTEESFRTAYQPFRTLGARLGGGPPPERYRQLAALIDAEVVAGLGARPTVRALTDSDGALRGSNETLTGSDQAPAAPGAASHPSGEALTGSVFVCESAHSAAPVAADVLIDGWLANPMLVQSADPLVCGLYAAGLVRSSSLEAASGGSIPTTSIDITADNRVIGPAGRAVPGLFSLGLPNDDVSGHSFVSPHPRSGANFLVETDRVALTIVGAPAGE